MRLLSHSEINSAATCEAMHDFRYGSQLAGTSLKSKTIAPMLQAGRAWGAAVAAYHIGLGSITPRAESGAAAAKALDASLNSDRERMEEFGVFDEENLQEVRERLYRILAHYMETAEPWVANDDAEHEIIVPVPSRSGSGRASSRYSFLSYLDVTRDIDGLPWIVEFKLRSQLTNAEFIALDRQIRRYAWAWWQHTGIKPAGVLMCERLNEPPKPPRMVQGRKKSDPPYVPSHAKDQLCTADAYKAVCSEHDVPMNPDTYEALSRRKWQQEVPIQFRQGELEEAGLEIVSAAQMIRDLDSGSRYPIRNSRPQNCRGCAFKDICPSPDEGLVDALFERVEPKRLRKENE